MYKMYPRVLIIPLPCVTNMNIDRERNMKKML